MDNGSLTFGRLVMRGRSLGGRQDQIIGGKHHSGAPVILRLRSPWRSFGFVPFFSHVEKLHLLFRVFAQPATYLLLCYVACMGK